MLLAHQASQQEKRHPMLLVLLIGISLTLSLVTLWIMTRGSQPASLFTMTNFVGPTTRSLLAGGGLSVCTEEMGTPGNPICFHAARMPMASLVVALGIRLFGDNELRVNILKTLLLLVPLELAIYLAWLRTPRSPIRQVGYVLLLLLPFAIAPFMADVLNMQVEEGYSYSMLALAVAVLLFAIRPGQRGNITNAIMFALALDGLYLAKSSMAPAVAVLVASYLLLERRFTARAIVLALAIAAPAGWALHQHHASRRYSIGTSLDGINLHKSNNLEFLKRYPPQPGDTLDQHDSDLNRGLHFADEWSFNDFHQHAAVAYLRTHPRETLLGDARKFNVLFFSIRKYGSAEPSGLLARAETAGMLVFRVLLWTAIAGSVYWLFLPIRGHSNARLLRLTGGIFLMVLAACVLPYLAGFAYTRHASILIYPSALMCCRMLAQEKLAG